jgi:hypothetical protein
VKGVPSAASNRGIAKFKESSKAFHGRAAKKIIVLLNKLL